ncbi:unnamed protein product, partial [Acidithrix sp. C25]
VSLQDAGTSTNGIVRCDQPCAIDLGAANARWLEKVPGSVLDEVLAKLAPIFE